MSTWKRYVLEVLAAVCGLGLVVGETVEAVLAEDDGGQDEFPGQRRGGGTHFKERVERAKMLGELPGLRKMAAKLREPRGLAAYTPPDDGQSTGAPSTGGGTRAKETEPQNEPPGRRVGGGTRATDGQVKKDQKEWPGRRVGGGTRATETPSAEDDGGQNEWPTLRGDQYKEVEPPEPGPTQTPPPE